MVVLDFSIVNVALAAIERELHADSASVQWVITAYAITFGGLLVLGGRVGDLWGRRRMFVVGLVVFSLASLIGSLAGDLTTLVIARAIQGIGAAIVAPAALSLITTSVPEGPARTRALGYYGATASIGYVAGLVLGGVLVQYLDWRAVLWVNVPIGIAAALLTPILVPKPPAHRWSPPGCRRCHPRHRQHRLRCLRNLDSARCWLVIRTHGGRSPTCADTRNGVRRR